jgi:hypothetical protein
VLLALDHDSELIANILKPAQNLAVSVGEVENRVRNASVVAEIADEELHLSEVMARHSGEEMVDSLELETAVDEVEPGRAVDVHGGSELALGEGLGLAKVDGGHSPVGQGDLDVQRHGDDVRDENEGDAGGPVGESAPEEAVAEEEPVANHEGNLSRADPPSSALSKLRGLLGEHVEPREEVEVETSNAHDWVVGVALVGHEEVGGGVPDEGEVVVG